MLIFFVAYLFLGALVMLATHEVLYRAMVRSEFVAGMLFWPIPAMVLVAALFGSSAVSLRSRLRVGSRR